MATVSVGAVIGVSSSKLHNCIKSQRASCTAMGWGVTVVVITVGVGAVVGDRGVILGWLVVGTTASIIVFSSTQKFKKEHHKSLLAGSGLLLLLLPSAVFLRATARPGDDRRSGEDRATLSNGVACDNRGDVV